MCASYRSKSRKTDFEQHANKIFTAIREINPEYAEKRAIWELFQNALDIVDSKGIIKIAKTKRGFIFQHNGRPFNDGNLTGLIKQTSNGKTYGSNKSEIGQYGTGFLSTHVYGKEIEISASVQTDSGRIKHLDNFLLDRKASTIDELTRKIQIQDEHAEKICDNEADVLTEHLSFTTFEYIESEDSKRHILNMFDYVPKILPFVFAFNDKLFSVEITNTTRIIFQRNKIDGDQLNLLVNNQQLNFSFLSDKESNIKIILPQKGFNFQDVPKLFLFYPLMDTSTVGLNFLIHAQEFKPNKDRDFLFLEAANEELINDVEKNKWLLNRAFELILSKIEIDETLDFLNVINIDFIQGEEEFLIEKKKQFIDSVKQLKRISVKGEKKELLSIPFVNKDILDLDEPIIRELFELLSQLYNLPSYDEYFYLSKLINNWADDSFNVLGFSDILDEIYVQAKGNYSNIIFKRGYQTLIKTISNNVELLNNYKAVPNINNELCYFNSLKKWDFIEESLIEIMDSINSDVSVTYLNKDFYFLDNLPSYSRENFKDDLNKFNGELISLLEKDDGKSLDVNSVRFNLLITTLVNFISLNKTTSTNLRFAEFFSRYYQLNVKQQVIERPTVVLNYDSSFKLLARLFVKDFISQGVESISKSIMDLSSFIEILYDNSELNKNLLDKLACFPNQVYELKAQNDLKIDKVLDEDFKLKHKEITEKEIKDHLLLPQFMKFISHTNEVEGEQLGHEIETKLSFDKDFLRLLKDSSKVPVLLDLIKFISKSNSKWSLWLPNINAVKEEILMTKFKDENTRLSLFSILSIDSKERINLLGELAKVDDLKSLIKAGKEKQREDRRKSAHLQYINDIGIRIQNLIQNQLDIELRDTIRDLMSVSEEKMESVEEQNGQDFIIYKSGKPIYYIEVKSRWDSTGIVTLSKRQVEKCAENKDCYAVITVNVADYKSRNNTVDENISFEDLLNDVYVNIDLGDNFEKLIKENQIYEKIQENTKLIDFRGHIPQERIKSKSINFNDFIKKLRWVIEQKGIGTY